MPNKSRSNPTTDGHNKLEEDIKEKLRRQEVVFSILIAITAPQRSR